MSRTHTSAVSSCPNGYPGDDGGGVLTSQWKQLKYLLLEQEENFPPEVLTELLLLLRALGTASLLRSGTGRGPVQASHTLAGI